jgi:transcriptional regulator with PAS, ATPase and Fis domain
VSATNKDLREEVVAGRFREDLLYRLNVITLQVPPLRERPEDIRILSEYFLARKSKPSHPKKLSPGALEILMQYDWPGNVRELEHVLEGAMLLAPGDVITPGELSIHPHRAGGSEGLSDAEEFPVSMEEMEKQHIDRVLQLNGYNRARTAEALGISKKTLYLKIKRYGLRVED